VADQAYPFVVSRLVPMGVRGVIFAALTGAVMSTIASLVSSSSAIVSVNFYQRFFNPKASGRQMIRVGRFAGLAVLLIGALWTPVVERFELVFAYFQECWVFFAAPITVVFLAGILWRRATADAAFYTLLLGFPMLLLVFLRRQLFPASNPFNLAGLLAILMLIFLAVFSLAQWRHPSPAGTTNLWHPALLRLPSSERVRRGFQSEKSWAAVLIIVYGLIYAWLW
jgi:SSS family solute:Na+ symporter